MRSIFLYGIGGARDQYRVIRYTRIDEPDFSINTLLYETSMMKMRYPSIEHVYAVDNRYGLGKTYLESVKKNSIESCAIFKDLIQRQGLEIK